jgi:predicted RNase H-like HicB family nuclease
MKKPQSYTINISHDPPPIPTNAMDWGCYLLDDEEGCHAHGETPEQALENFQFAFSCYLDRQDELNTEQERLEARQCQAEDLDKAKRRGEL